MFAMKFSRRWAGVAAWCALSASAVWAADHGDAPGVGSILNNNTPAETRQVDVNDVYLFQSPANARNTVMVMTVNPLAGVLSPTTFSTNAIFEFRITNAGDAKSEIIYQVQFGFPGVNGVQSVGVTRFLQGVVAKGTTNANIPIQGGGLVRAGVFDDPFFFDLLGFNRVIAGTGTFSGTDFFKGMNTCAIIIEVPSAVLISNPNNPMIGLHCRTVRNGIQIDRKGRPAINTVLLVGGARKDAFNAGFPENDFQTFGPEVNARIAALSGSQATANALTPILLPDVLTFNVNSASGFLNGRRLADDVIDAELSLLTNGAITTDGVNAPDKAFLSTFPYLAAPHIIP